MLFTEGNKLTVACFQNVCHHTQFSTLRYKKGNSQAGVMAVKGGISSVALACREAEEKAGGRLVGSESRQAGVQSARRLDKSGV